VTVFQHFTNACTRAQIFTHLQDILHALLSIRYLPLVTFTHFLAPLCLRQLRSSRTRSIEGFTAGTTNVQSAKRSADIRAWFAYGLRMRASRY